MAKTKKGAIKTELMNDNIDKNVYYNRLKGLLQRCCS
jgi:hypothetical protein